MKLLQFSFSKLYLTLLVAFILKINPCLAQLYTATGKQDSASVKDYDREANNTYKKLELTYGLNLLFIANQLEFQGNEYLASNKVGMASSLKAYAAKIRTKIYEDGIKSYEKSAFNKKADVYSNLFYDTISGIFEESIYDSFKIKKYNKTPEAQREYFYLMVNALYRHILPNLCKMMNLRHGKELASTLKEENEKYFRLLPLVADFHLYNNENDKAINEYTQLIESNLYIKADSAQAEYMSNLARAYTQAGMPIKAEKYYLESKEKYEAWRDRTNHKKIGIRKVDIEAEIANIYTNLGMIAAKMQSYKKAELFFEYAISTLDKLQLRESNAYANTLHEYANLLAITNNAESARKKYAESLLITRNLNLSNSPIYAFRLIDYALFCKEQNDEWTSESIYQEAIDIAQIYSTIDNSVSNKLAGNFEKNSVSTTFNTEAFENLSNAFDALNKGQSFINLLKGLQQLSNYTSSKSANSFEAARKLVETNLGYYFIRYEELSSLPHISQAYFLQVSGKYQLAKKKYEEVEKKFNLSPTQVNHLFTHVSDDYGLLLRSKFYTDYADLSVKMGEYRNAENYYNTAIKFLNERHNRFKVFILQKIANLHQLNNNITKAFTSLKEANEITLTESINISAYLTEKEQLLVQHSLQNSLDQYLSFYLQNPQFMPQMADLIFENIKIKKNTTLNELVALKERISNNPQLTAQLNDFIQEKEKLEYITYSVETNKEQIKTQEDLVQLKEKQLIVNSHKFLRNNEKRAGIWQDLKKVLKKGEALVEFIHFPLYTGNKKTDSVVYAAILLSPTNDTPLFIRLCEEKKLQASILNTNSGITEQEQVQKIYKPENLNSELYLNTWEPIEKNLKNVSKIYYSLSGLLNRFSHVAIQDPKQRILSEKYGLVCLSNAQQLLNKRAEFSLKESKNAVLLGGINYNVSSSMPTGLINNQPSEAVSWAYLEGTKSEVCDAEQALLKNKFKVTTYLDSDANESNLQQSISSKPYIIHFATHGFYLSYKKEFSTNTDFNRFQFFENPLLRSGLVLAGANINWLGSKTTSKRNDGILSALEVSNFNLSSTKLVVLSACETGLGDIAGSEGVFGLQRAFKIAGAEYLLMSLWKVPDATTAEMMKYFYEHLAKNIPIEDAFAKAQRKMCDKYDNIYYWAGFVLIK